MCELKKWLQLGYLLTKVLKTKSIFIPYLPFLAKLHKNTLSILIFYPMFLSVDRANHPQRSPLNAQKLHNQSWCQKTELVKYSLKQLSHKEKIRINHKVLSSYATSSILPKNRGWVATPGFLHMTFKKQSQLYFVFELVSAWIEFRISGILKSRTFLYFKRFPLKQTTDCFISP